MTLILPPLPYAKDALAPHMSAETLDYHHDKHHKTYVETANKLLKGSEFEQSDEETIIRKATGKLYNNVAQAWNHTFFWNCLTPKSGEPPRAVADAIAQAFGGLDEFRKAFNKTAAEVFGTGWAWLVRDTGGALKIVGKEDAGNPLRDGQVPLLTVDVWEHAYYIDYRNERPKYLEHFWSIVNWDFVAENLAGANRSGRARP